MRRRICSIMRILGHGIDLVDIADLARWIEDARNPLLTRCFTTRELASIGENADRLERIAGRFAAKEAVMKALGTGFGAGVAFTDVEIYRPDGCPPEVRLEGGAINAAARIGITNWQLSISHTSSFAMASAIALGDHLPS